jgi:hypothetical protein
MRFSFGHAASRGHDSRGGKVAVGGWFLLGVGNAVGAVGRRVGRFVGGRVGGRVGLLVGVRVGRRVGTGVGLGGLAPFTMANDTRYAVPTCPFTVAVTVWAPAWRFGHGLYDFPPQRV